jgi:hypothetical protein
MLVKQDLCESTVFMDASEVDFLLLIKYSSSI